MRASLPNEGYKKKYDEAYNIKKPTLIHSSSDKHESIAAKSFAADRKLMSQD